MALVQLPLPQINFIQEGGTPTREFYDYLKALDTLVRRLSGALEWTPVLQGSSSDPTVTGTAVAHYQIAGSYLMFVLKMEIATISGGSGDARITLPVAEYNGGCDVPCSIYVEGMDWGVGRVTPAALVVDGEQYVSIIAERHDATNDPITIADFANGDVIAISGVYRWKV